jgi:hypothetical protein
MEINPFSPSKRKKNRVYPIAIKTKLAYFKRFFNIQIKTKRNNLHLCAMYFFAKPLQTLKVS